MSLDLGLLLGAVAAIIAAIFGYGRSQRKKGRTEVRRDVEARQARAYEETRERIDDADRHDSVDAARGFLHDRQDRRKR